MDLKQMDNLANRKNQNVPKESSTPNPSPSTDDSSTLTSLLKQFISIQSNMMNLKGQIKTLTQTSKQIECKILSIMNDNHLQNIDTQNNIIQIKTTTVKRPINSKMLTSFFGAQLNIPQETIQQFVNELPSKTTQSLSIKLK